MIFTAEENEIGQVITTTWVHVQAISQECDYKEEDFKNMKLIIGFKEVIKNLGDQKKCARSDQIKIKQSPTIKVESRILETLEPKLQKTTKTTAKPSTKPSSCQSNEDKIEELSKKRALQGQPLFLRRWREYDIELVIEDQNKGTSKTKVIRYNTFLWTCPGTCQSIGQTELCDGHEDCAGGADEHPKTCSVSQLPQKIAYTIFGYMLLLITILWMFLGSKKPARHGNAIEMPGQITFNKEEYRSHHQDSNFSHAQEVMKHTYNNLFNINDKQVEEICQQVRDLEVEIHGDPKEAYTCILEHYSGDHPLSARLANPTGGALGRAKKLVNDKVNPETRWFGVSIISRFVFLCLLHFDYVKDIGKMTHKKNKSFSFLPDIAVILEHFDRVVIQSKYEPYHGFNFHYLFVTSVCLICTSHVVTFIYWTLRRICNPEVTKVFLGFSIEIVHLQIFEYKKGNSMVKRVLLWVLPSIPTTLPTMLFCRISELTILLEDNNPLEHDVWEKMVAERVTLMDIANDIKIIGNLLMP